MHVTLQNSFARVFGRRHHRSYRFHRSWVRGKEGTRSLWKRRKPVRNLQHQYGNFQMPPPPQKARHRQLCHEPHRKTGPLCQREGLSSDYEFPGPRFIFKAIFVEYDVVRFSSDNDYDTSFTFDEFLACLYVFPGLIRHKS
ncbi:hypothetical protein J6590_072055 [Homalodisca vitripennis]|nr:hypothetical protein J6590_072055 [Homalodisca vitripennis]